MSCWRRGKKHPSRSSTSTGDAFFYFRLFPVFMVAFETSVKPYGCIIVRPPEHSRLARQEPNGVSETRQEIQAEMPRFFYVSDDHRGSSASTQTAVRCLCRPPRPPSSCLGSLGNFFPSTCYICRPSPVQEGLSSRVSPPRDRLSTRKQLPDLRGYSDPQNNKKHNNKSKDEKKR